MAMVWLIDIEGAVVFHAGGIQARQSNGPAPGIGYQCMLEDAFHAHSNHPGGCECGISVTRTQLSF